VLSVVGNTCSGQTTCCLLSATTQCCCLVVPFLHDNHSNLNYIRQWAKIPWSHLIYWMPMRTQQPIIFKLLGQCRSFKYILLSSSFLSAFTFSGHHRESIVSICLIFCLLSSYTNPLSYRCSPIHK
jgi:hypothetical protein